MRSLLVAWCASKLPIPKIDAVNEGRAMKESSSSMRRVGLNVSMERNMAAGLMLLAMIALGVRAIALLVRCYAPRNSLFARKFSLLSANAGLSPWASSA
jgi:hypothetical protein